MTAYAQSQGKTYSQVIHVVYFLSLFSSLCLFFLFPSWVMGIASCLTRKLYNCLCPVSIENQVSGHSVYIFSQFVFRFLPVSWVLSHAWHVRSITVLPSLTKTRSQVIKFIYFLRLCVHHHSFLSRGCCLMLDTYARQPGAMLKASTSILKTKGNQSHRDKFLNLDI